jgi:transcriptional regulator with XRE-family HTH domain
MHPYKTFLFKKIFGGRTLTKFAQVANISAGNLSRITHGQNASAEVLQKIAYASSDKTINYQRLLNLFSYVPDGRINIKEFKVFVSRIKPLIELTSDVQLQKRFPTHDLDFNKDLIYDYCGLPEMYMNDDSLPTYEDVYCIADIFMVPFEYLLNINYDFTPREIEEFSADQSTNNMSQNRNKIQSSKLTETSIASKKALPDFTDATEAMKFILEQPVLMAYGGYDLHTMENQDIIDMANDILYAVKLSAERQKRKDK